MTTILVAEKLSRNFGGIQAIDDLSFALSEGEIVALIGPNGAGKSTCFNVISGYYPASSGTLWFDGAEITHEPMHLIARRGIARTFQTTSLFRSASVLDNATIGKIARPKKIHMVPDMPKTRSGKIMRRVLAAISNNLDTGDITTLANPDVVAQIREQVQGRGVGPLKDGPADIKLFGQEN